MYMHIYICILCIYIYIYIYIYGMYIVFIYTCIYVYIYIYIYMYIAENLKNQQQVASRISYERIAMKLHYSYNISGMTVLYHRRGTKH